MRSMVEGQTVASDRARFLRKNMTPPERRLWRVLRARPEGFKFRCQHPIGPYILDFFCCESAAAIEVDGFAHDLGSNPLRDMKRDQWVAAEGVRTVRVPATEVRDNFEGVVAFIVEACRERTVRTE